MAEAGPDTQVAPAKDGGPLDLKQIVDVTRCLMESAGLQSVTMRRVASELGVSAMGLYHHVRDKSALLALVADDVMGSIAFPGSDVGPWYERIRRSMLTVHREVNRYPGLGVHIWSPKGLYPSYPKGFEKIRAVLDTLVEAGFSEREALSAVHLLSAYEGGFFAVERAPERDEPPVEQADNISEELRKLRSHSSDEGTAYLEIYREGVDTIIAGLRAQLAAKQVLMGEATNGGIAR